MTLQELTHIAELTEQLRRDEETLRSLQEAVHPGSQNLSGMPHTTGVHDKIGDLAVEIADLKDCIQQQKQKIAAESARAEQFIRGIEDGQTRTIFRLRFLRALSWKEVASVVGRWNTEQSVSKKCYNYLQSINVEQIGRSRKIEEEQGS